MYDGEGKLYINDSLYYSGLFKLGQQNGSGKLYKNNKIVFDGIFYNNSKDGTGALYYDNSDNILYHGQFSNDLRNGFGTTLFS